MSGALTRLLPTASQTAGPFFHFALAPDARLGCLVGPETPGDRLLLDVRVFDGDGAPVPDALVEVYQADADGRYAIPEPAAAGAFSGFGRLATGTDGACTFETIRPGRVPDGRGGLQAAHIHACVLGRGLNRHLFTRIYFEGDTALDRDPLRALVPPERRQTLLARPANGAPARWTFDVRLQGVDETVFFDL